MTTIKEFWSNGFEFFADVFLMSATRQTIIKIVMVYSHRGKKNVKAKMVFHVLYFIYT